MIGAEHGLDLARLSLDFRPNPNPAAGGARGRIEATLDGSFEALYEYLRRVESLRLPLRPDEIALRPDASSENLMLSVSWSAVWGPTPGNSDELSDDDVARLDRFLARKDPPLPERSPFSAPILATSPRSAGDAGPAAVHQPESAPPPSTGVAAAEKPPTLAGFVLARPEVEKDLSRRVLAALKFEGEMHLVQIGDVIGSFRVERIDARDSVVLLDRTTGERLQLFLQ